MSIARLMQMAAGKTSAPPGQAEFTTTGSQSWVVPDGVRSISVVCVGGGEGGGTTHGGYGGNLRYKNTISVTPGETLDILVGPGGVGHSSTTTSRGGDGTDSSVKRSTTTLVLARGGHSASTEVYDGGGTGGVGDVPYAVTSPYGTVNHGGGGGGAGGYSGNGGNARSSGAGGGGGGGGRTTASAIYSDINDYYFGRPGSGGGGVGLQGQGASGAGSSTSTGKGGSGGSDAVLKVGGTYGGGAGGGYTRVVYSPNAAGGAGTQGAVRIIWPGDERLFPSTRTSDE